MSGENAQDDIISGKSDVDRTVIPTSRRFYAQKVWQRASVVASGPLMNFLIAIVIYALIFMVFGVPTSLTDKAIIGDISPGGPAAQAGLLPGDQIVRVGEESIASWDELAQKIRTSPNQEVVLAVLRGERQFSITVEPRQERPDGPGLIGIVPMAETKERIPFFQAFWYGAQQTWYMIVALVVGLFQMITGQLLGPISGPVGIAKMAGQAARFGAESLLNLTAVLSVNLGVLNLLPFPALDGGRLVFLGVEAIRRKPVDPEREGFVHFIGFAVLMIFILLVTFREVVGLF